MGCKGAGNGEGPLGLDGRELKSTERRAILHRSGYAVRNLDVRSAPHVFFPLALLIVYSNCRVVLDVLNVTAAVAGCVHVRR